MQEASLCGCQCRVRCCCLRRKAPMCGNHGIDNRPTVDATPSGILMVTRPESSKIFKLLTHHQSTAECAPHRMPPSLRGPCVWHVAPFFFLLGRAKDWGLLGPRTCLLFSLRPSC